MNLDALYEQAMAVLYGMLPRFAAAIILCMTTAVIGAGVKVLVMRAARRLPVVRHSATLQSAAAIAALVKTMLWLFALPYVAQLLGLSQLSGQLMVPVARIAAFLPNIIGAGVILVIGNKLSGAVKESVVAALRLASIDDGTGEAEPDRASGRMLVAEVAGALTHATMLLFVAIAALQALGVDTVGKSLTALLTTLTGASSRILGSVVLVIVAIIGGRVLADWAGRTVQSERMARFIDTAGFTPYFRRLDLRPADLANVAVMVGVLLLALAQASAIVEARSFNRLMTTAGLFAVNVAAGVLVFVAAAWLGSRLAVWQADVAGSVQEQGSRDWVRIAVPALALPIALRQVGLPQDIITVGLAVFLLAAALATALAFGLGGRHIAEHIVAMIFQNCATVPSEVQEKASAVSSASSEAFPTMVMNPGAPDGAGCVQDETVHSMGSK